MESSHPYRLLVDVQPRLLSDALIRILEKIGLDEVSTDTRPPQRFDAAIVTRPLPAHIESRLVITLPEHDSAAPSGFGTVGIDGRLEKTVAMGGLGAIISLLDEYYPAATSRLAMISIG
jgi:hypothetical protein